jgi:hypothetical protein
MLKVLKWRSSGITRTEVSILHIGMALRAVKNNIDDGDDRTLIGTSISLFIQIITVSGFLNPSHIKEPAHAFHALMLIYANVQCLLHLQVGHFNQI